MIVGGDVVVTPGGCCGGVNQEGVDAKQEHQIPTSQVLQALKQQKLHL
jgi:hypothetical protein